MRMILRAINLLIWAGIWWLIWHNNGQTTDPYRFIEQAGAPIILFIIFDREIRRGLQKDKDRYAIWGGEAKGKIEVTARLAKSRCERLFDRARALLATSETAHLRFWKIPSSIGGSAAGTLWP